MPAPVMSNQVKSSQLIMALTSSGQRRKHLGVALGMQGKATISSLLLARCCTRTCLHVSSVENGCCTTGPGRANKAARRRLAHLETLELQLVLASGRGTARPWRNEVERCDVSGKSFSGRVAGRSEEDLKRTQPLSLLDFVAVL